jgi:hypothetical protein
MKRLLIVLAAMLLGTTLQLKADSASFADQPAGASTFAYSSGPETITEGIATFSGGVILTGETFADQNVNVYATCARSTCGITYTFSDPMTITFSQPVSDLTVEIVNNLPDTFILADNNGNYVSANLPYLADTSITLDDAGITSATIGTADDGWDFALEGGGAITFTPDLPPDPPYDPTSTPEPATASLLGAGLMALAALSRKKSAA